MPIAILVSCDRRRTRFRQCIKRICDGSKGRYEYHYIPDEVAPPREQDRLQRMLDLVRASNMVFMDVTPARVVGRQRRVEHVTNSGVLIEYGVLASHTAYAENLRLFCENSVRRSELHPYFLKTVHSYSRKNMMDEDKPQSLRSMVKAMIEEFEKQLPERARKQAEENEALKRYLRDGS